MTYVDFQELLHRDSTLTDYDDAAINSGTIYYAERDVEGRLAQAFTVPFDAAHPTVKDLVIDESLWRLEKGLDRKAEMRAALDARYARLLAGTEYLMTGSGSITPTTGGDTGIWSPLSGYKPTFDTRDVTEQRIDPDRQDAEDLEDA